MRRSTVVASVSLILRTFSPDAVREARSSTDAVALPTDAFEALVVPGPGWTVGPESRRLLAQRPNVRLVDLQGAPSSWRDELAGEYTMLLADGEFPLPRSLPVLLAFAREHELDGVCGRVVNAEGGPVDGLVRDDPALTRVHVSSSTTWLLRTDLIAAAADDHLVPPHGARLGAIASYPAAYRRSASGAATRTASATAQWRHGVLNVRATPVLTDRKAVATAATVQHLSSFEEFLLDLRVDSEGVVHFALDPSTAAGGSPLSSGLWRLRLEVVDGDGLASTVELISSPVGSAIIDGVPLTGARDRWLTLDVGCTSTPLVPGLDPRNVRLEETSGGNRFSVAVPGIHMPRAERLTGQLLLGELSLIALVSPGRRGPELSALVSGVPGRVELAARFGTGRAESLGLTMTFHAEGGMSVAALTDELDEPDVAAASSGAGPGDLPRGPVARVRRAVPTALEPVARRAARWPLARRTYRRVTGLPAS